MLDGYSDSVLVAIHLFENSSLTINCFYIQNFILEHTNKVERIQVNLHEDRINNVLKLDAGHS